MTVDAMAPNDLACVIYLMQCQSRNLELMNACALLSVLKRSSNINIMEMSLMCC